MAWLALCTGGYVYNYCVVINASPIVWISIPERPGIQHFEWLEMNYSADMWWLRHPLSPDRIHHTLVAAGNGLRAYMLMRRRGYQFKRLPVGRSADRIHVFLRRKRSVDRIDYAKSFIYMASFKCYKYFKWIKSGMRSRDIFGRLRLRLRLRGSIPAPAPAPAPGKIYRLRRLRLRLRLRCSSSRMSLNLQYDFQKCQISKYDLLLTWPWVWMLPWMSAFELCHQRHPKSVAETGEVTNSLGLRCHK